MGRAKLFLFIYLAFMLVLFSLMCYLITTVNPEVFAQNGTDCNGNASEINQTTPSPGTGRKKIREFLIGILNYVNETQEDYRDGSDVMRARMPGSHRKDDDDFYQPRQKLQRVHPPLKPLLDIFKNLSYNLPILQQAVNDIIPHVKDHKRSPNDYEEDSEYENKDIDLKKDDPYKIHIKNIPETNQGKNDSKRGVKDDNWLE